MSENQKEENSENSEKGMSAIDQQGCGQSTGKCRVVKRLRSGAQLVQWWQEPKGDVFCPSILPTDASSVSAKCHQAIRLRRCEVKSRRLPLCPCHLTPEAHDTLSRACETLSYWQIPLVVSG